MKYRKLGRTDLSVSEMGFGAWGIGGLQWIGAEDDTSLAALRRSFELGLNFIDTALAYGGGHSEVLCGRAVREAPERIYLATKVPPKNQRWPARLGTPIEEVYPYEHIVASTEQSLRNLGLETIDLQQLHVWNPEWTDREWRRAFEDLKRDGKIRYAGVSLNAHEADTGLGVIGTGLIDAVQVIYNIFDQSPEPRLFPAAMEQQVGILARVPLDEGGLTGKITENTEFAPGEFRSHYFQGDRKRQVVERVAALERDLGTSDGELPQIALRFCLTHPTVTTVIPGMRSLRHVEINCAIPDAGPLPPDVLATIARHGWDRNFYD